MWWFIIKYLLLQVSIAFAIITLLSLLWLLPCLAVVVAACLCYHCGEKKLSHQYCIYLFYLALSVMIVSLTAKATSTTMVMASVMIYHHLFYDSNKMIVAIIYMLLLICKWTSFANESRLICKWGTYFSLYANKSIHLQMSTILPFFQSLENTWTRFVAYFLICFLRGNSKLWIYCFQILCIQNLQLPAAFVRLNFFRNRAVEFAEKVYFIE